LKKIQKTETKTSGADSRHQQFYPQQEGRYVSGAWILIALGLFLNLILIILFTHQMTYPAFAEFLFFIGNKEVS